MSAHSLSHTSTRPTPNPTEPLSHCCGHVPPITALEKVLFDGDGDGDDALLCSKKVKNSLVEDSNLESTLLLR